MNKRGHILNGLLLGVGIGVVLEPAGDVSTLLSVVAVTPPVVLGAMVPDIDTAFGTHRKTLHNLPVLAFFYAFPPLFGNLSFVWLGVLSHYVLDVLGSKRGIALFYPYPEEYGFPTGVATSSRWALPVTLAVTAVELGAVFLIVDFQLPVTDLGATTELLRTVIGA